MAGSLRRGRHGAGQVLRSSSTARSRSAFSEWMLTSSGKRWRRMRRMIRSPKTATLRWFPDSIHCHSGLKTRCPCALGESRFYPKAGSRLKEYFDAFEKSPWLPRWVKLEVVRLACVPYYDLVQRKAYPLIPSVLQVLEVEQITAERTTGQPVSHQRSWPELVRECKGWPR